MAVPPFRSRGVSAALLLVCLLIGALRAGPTDVPTHGGVLRLVEGWQWCESGAFEQDRRSPTTEDGILNLRQLGREKRRSADRVIWRVFTVPVEWREKPVWMTYDGRCLAACEVRGVYLNGKALPIALPVSLGEGFCSPTVNPEAGDSATTNWFLDIARMLEFGGTNTVAIRLAQWPPLSNGGVWLYSPPRHETAVFVVSGDVSPFAREKIGTIARLVTARFAVRVSVIDESFDAPESLRNRLHELWATEKISGAVLFGQHPVPRYTLTGKAKNAFSLARYYEDLDTAFLDTDGDGVLDSARPGAVFGPEIWTSWVRLVDEHTELFEGYLDKAIAYYEGRLPVPEEPLVLGTPHEVRTSHEWQICPGLLFSDRFRRPSFMVEGGAHGGVAFAYGPNMTVPAEEALAFYPGAVVTRIGGCGAGNIRPEKIKIPEAYLFGRSNCILASSTAPSVGGSTPTKHEGVLAELARILPHMGPLYSYLSDFRGNEWPHGFDAAEILFGIPFVRCDKRFSAPSGSIRCRVTQGEAGTPMSEVYVEAQRDGLSFGRVRTDAEGTCTVAGLPPGRYTLQLHTNALESRDALVVVSAGRVAAQQWHLDRPWGISGQIVGADGEPDPHAWVEIADAPEEKLFCELNDLLPVLVDPSGRFGLLGTGTARLWCRARSMKRLASEPVELRVKPGDSRTDIRLQVKPREGRGRTFSADELLAFEPSAELEIPQQDAAVHPLLDVRKVHAVMLAQGAPTLRFGGRPTKQFRGRERADHTIRVALEFREPLPDVPEADARYRIFFSTGVPLQEGARPLPGDTDHSVGFGFKRVGSVWLSKQAWRTEAPLFFSNWPFGGSAVDDCLFVDVTPFAGHEQIDWRFHVEIMLTAEGERTRRRIPESGSWRLRGSVGDTPLVDLEE